MGRRRRHAPLRVHLNNLLVGRLVREPGGGISFQYDDDWLSADAPVPVSLSLPLRPDAYRGAAVAAVFDNLLPDSETLRRRVAERVGAEGSDPYSLLAAIGRDCVGALQFIAGDDDAGDAVPEIAGEPLDEDGIARLLGSLAQAPLGLSRDDDFRISIAGAQEKTALLREGDRWLKPFGTTPTTHILKPQIGELPGGIDLRNSVENEFYCLRLLAAFGLPVNHAEMVTFGATRALVIERFDRRRRDDGRLLRVPQEDCCQALAIPPSRKYQSDGGPSLLDILRLFADSDTPDEDRAAVFKAQLLFWLIGATDGHAKNFSLFLGSRGSFQLTPLYDVLTAQPSLDAGQIQPKQMKLAMSVGSNRHYLVSGIHGRHFLQTANAAGLPGTLASSVIEGVASGVGRALERVAAELPAGFPMSIHDAVRKAVLERVDGLTE